MGVDVIYIAENPKGWGPEEVSAMTTGRIKRGETWRTT